MGLVKSDMKISVVTVVFNGRDHIEATIKSVREQDYDNIEYIVVDGGSTDGTLDIVQESDCVDAWVSAPDKGIYDAMNKALDLVHGKYVIYMNAGDLFFSKDVVSRAVEQINPTDEVVYGDYYTLGSRRNDGHHSALPLVSLKYGMITSHQSMFFCSRLMKKMPYSLRYGTAGDYALIYKQFRQGVSFKKLDSITVSYYQAGGVSDVKRISSIMNARRARRDLNGEDLKSFLTYLYSLGRAYLTILYCRLFETT